MVGGTRQYIRLKFWYILPYETILSYEINIYLFCNYLEVHLPAYNFRTFGWCESKRDTELDFVFLVVSKQCVIVELPVIVWL